MILASLLLVAAQDAAERPPNVVVLLVDDLGAHDLACTGSTFHETPHCDRLAAEGVRMTRAWAAAPVCSPSRAALLTGKAPARIDTTDYFGGRRKKALLPAPYVDHLALEEVTLAEALQDAGYRTGFFGKWHLGGEGHEPERQGFDVNVGGWRAGHPYQGYFAPWGNPALEDGPEGEYLTDRLTDEACAFVRESKEGPFLCYLAYYTVHTPLQAKPEKRAPYVEKRAALGYSDDERWGTEGARKVRLVQDHATYAGMVASLDESVGRVLDLLDELDLADDTIVVLTSDNGGLSTSEGHPTSNLPLRAGKGWPYEGGIRVPMLWRGPGIEGGGRTTDAAAIGMDLYPTVLELCGLPARPEQHVDGTSLADVLGGATPPAGRELYWHYPHYGNQGGAPCSVARIGPWKLIEWYEGGVELYRTDRDVGERVDLVASEDRMLDGLSNRLDAWRREVDAQVPSPNPDWEEPAGDGGRR